MYNNNDKKYKYLLYLYIFKSLSYLKYIYIYNNKNNAKFVTLI